MREVKNHQERRESTLRRHPVRQQLLAAFLGLCLIVVSVPVSQAGFLVQAAEPEQENSELRQNPEESVTADDGETGGEDNENESKPNVGIVSEDDGESPGVTDENERKEFQADFYSGSAGNKETIAAEMGEDFKSGIVTAPELKPMEGFTAVGWSKAPNVFECEIEAGKAVTLTKNTAYYGVYEKTVTLSYDANGGDTCPADEVKVCRVSVSEENVSYDIPAFTAAAALTRNGYVFAGWNSKQTGGESHWMAGESRKLDSDTMLCAMWAFGSGAPYRVEHYKQDLVGDGYTRVDTDTEYIAGKTGIMVVAEANPYTGYTLNTEQGLGKPAGIVAEDGSLVLQLYYDRNIYEIDFDLNGGEGVTPEMQTVRYGGLLQEVEEPRRTGYTFKGWYMDEEGSESAYWDIIYRTVEDNTESQKFTLYAKWADETAPVLGKADFGTGYKTFADWIVARKKLTITVPVTEEGTGLKQGNYRLVSEDGKVKEGEAAIRSLQGVAQGVHARSGGLSAVMTIRGNARSGNYTAVITIEETFKGSVFLTCTDNAEKSSVEKILTVDGSGLVVEDNAPDIRFSKAKKNAVKSTATVNVDVTDSAGNHVSAGIASVSYRIDGGKVIAEDKEAFAYDMVENYSFAVDIKGEGKHTLQVTAVDNAGNKSIKNASVEIKGKKATVGDKPETPGPEKTPGPDKTPVAGNTPVTAKTPASAGTEPVTGESTFVKIFATLGMIAGFTYLLLYFASGENGITEDEKEEFIARLVRWAQRGRFRKYPALIIISLFLIYYHSIGKSVSDEWRKVCEG